MFSLVIMEKFLLFLIFRENACRKACEKVFEKAQDLSGKRCGGIQKKMQGFVEKHLHRHIYATDSAFSAGCLIFRTME